MRKRRIIPCPLETRSILWEGASVIKLIRELQDFLKTKMKQVNDPTFGTYWICKSCDWSKEHGCWEKTIEFCERKGLEWNTLTEILNHLSGFAYNIACDADVLNRLPVKGEGDGSEPDVPSNGTRSR
jgi:hypothetical protein